MSKLMKGHTWAKGKHKLTYPAFAEVKVDEVRVDVRLVDDYRIEYLSYAGKPLSNLSRFDNAFRSYMTSHGVSRLDMGVLVNNTFADTYRWVRSSKGVPAGLEDAHIVFLLFDIPEVGAMPYSQRVGIRSRAANLLRDYGVPAVVPERHVIAEEAEVMELYGKVRERGFEGLMVKSADHTYETDKRSYGWLKVKPENDADALITGVQEAVSEAGEPLGRVGSLQGVDEAGQPVSIPGIDHTTGGLWFTEPSLIVGQWVEFVYMERDRQGGYRHPRFNRVREEKA